MLSRQKQLNDMEYKSPLEYEVTKKGMWVGARGRQEGGYGLEIEIEVDVVEGGDRNTRFFHLMVNNKRRLN